MSYCCYSCQWQNSHLSEQILVRAALGLYSVIAQGISSSSCFLFAGLYKVEAEEKEDMQLLIPLPVDDLWMHPEQVAWHTMALLGEQK